MEMTAKSTPQFVKKAWSFSATALFAIVVYHYLSGSSSKNWNGDERKSASSICWNGGKCFNNSFIYDCCLSSFVRIFAEFLRWRWQDKRHLKMLKRREVFQWQLYIRLLFIIFCQDLRRTFEMEMTGKATLQFVGAAWRVSVKALNTIVVYHQMSGSSSTFNKGDDRKSGTSFCRKGMKCFSNSFIYDCCMSSIVRIFIDYLKWRWQEKETSKCRSCVKFFNNSFVYDTIVVNHHLSGSSSNVWNGDDKKSDSSICWNGGKCFNKSFIYDCCLSSFVRIFAEYSRWRWQDKRHLNMSKRREVFQWQLYIRLLFIIICQDLHRMFEMEMTGIATLQFVEMTWRVSVKPLNMIVVYQQ